MLRYVCWGTRDPSPDAPLTLPPNPLRGPKRVGGVDVEGCTWAPPMAMVLAFQGGFQGRTPSRMLP